MITSQARKESVMTELRTDRFTLRIAPSLKELAKQLAQSEGRTVSNYIEKLIRDDAKKKGLV